MHTTFFAFYLVFATYFMHYIAVNKIAIFTLSSLLSLLDLSPYLFPDSSERKDNAFGCIGYSCRNVCTLHENFLFQILQWSTTYQTFFFHIFFIIFRPISLVTQNYSLLSFHGIFQSKNMN